MLVRDRMSVHPVTIRADVDYKTALKLMQNHALHHVPVLDGTDRLVGIVAERDLLLAAMHYLQSAIEVSEVMHHDVVTATPDMPISKAAMLMVKHKIGGLPVVDGTQGVVGIITETDIFRAFVEMSQHDAAMAGRSVA
jgi:acetoin utilization protein AcuB